MRRVRSMSFSMWVTDKDPHGEAGFDGVQPRTRPQWVDDASVTRCAKCAAEFGWLGEWQRHHCRLCGCVFCNRCSSKRAVIPEDVAIPVAPRRKRAGMDRSRPMRVCDACHVKCQQLRRRKAIPEGWSGFTRFIAWVRDVRTLRAASQVCREWRRIASFELSKIFEIQYVLQGLSYTPEAAAQLWAQRHAYPGHSRWMVHLVRAWGDREPAEVARLLCEHAQRPERDRKECWRMMCSRSCRPGLTLEETVRLLDECVTTEALRKLVVQHFLEPQARSDRVPCFLPVLTAHLGSTRAPARDNSLGDWLLRQCVRDERVAAEVYWDLHIMRQSPRPETVRLAEHWMGLWMRAVDAGVRARVLDARTFATRCEQARAPGGPVLGDCKTCVSPLHPERGVARIDLERVHAKRSKTCPLVVPLVWPGRAAGVLFKNEDVRRDRVAMTFIRLSKAILRDELGFELPIVTYRVRPTAPDAGFVELVPDSRTWYDLDAHSRFSVGVYNFIDDSQTVGEFRERLLQSTAAYCVLSYLLGAGDRHKHNIMVTRRGCLFHIDYGYILGHQPSRLMRGLAPPPDMRIDPSLVEALGPAPQFDRLKDLCDRIYNALRRHVDVLACVLRVLVLADPPIYRAAELSHDQLMAEISRRFVPGEHHEAARVQLGTRIDNSTRSTAHYALADTMHQYAHESSVVRVLRSGWHIVRSAVPL